MELHFLHIPSKNLNALPLMLIHGWPSSFFEYLKIIPLLQDSFHLIIPSLPGYGPARPFNEPGLGIYRVAEIFHALVTSVLKYKRYALQGGDWGAYCASRMAFLYPESIAGLHLSYVVGGLIPFIEDQNSLSSEEKKMLGARASWAEREGGYEHLQATKPQSLAFALTDSPVGLCAWILEKWNSWTDCNGDLLSKFSKDELLANVSWYWFTKSLGSAVRMYYETARNPWVLQKEDKIRVPTAVASFPRELVVSPREWAERIYNVVQWTDMARGGHFAATEEPVALANDIKKFLSTIS